MRIAMIGSNASSATPEMKAFALKLGKGLVDNGYIIVNGGMGGVMEAAARGARSSEKYDPTKMIGILPVTDANKGNAHLGITIVTDLGSGRNRLIILNCDAVVAIGGGAGTLNEIALAWELKKPIASYLLAGGWAEKLGDTRIDNRREDKISGVRSVDEVLEWLATLRKKDP